jgi:hypothetical protein
MIDFIAPSRPGTEDRMKIRIEEPNPCVRKLRRDTVDVRFIRVLDDGNSQTTIINLSISELADLSTAVNEWFMRKGVEQLKGQLAKLVEMLGEA